LYQTSYFPPPPLLPPENVLPQKLLDEVEQFVLEFALPTVCRGVWVADGLELSEEELIIGVGIGVGVKL
jgi:hypothetical protein